MAHERWAASRRAAAPTKKPIWSRSWCVQASASNNVDTCARVCHSPTGYGLKQTFGTSAGTQDFDSVMDADVILVIGANPTDAHPVFGSRMKQRLRQGAKLIVIDPRRSIWSARPISRRRIIWRCSPAPMSRY
jgi:predicted molibdopterin-dependent oxidoreductase YjgC